MGGGIYVKRNEEKRIAAKTRPQKLSAPSKNFGKIFKKLGKIFKNFTKFFQKLSEFLRGPCLRIPQESCRQEGLFTQNAFAQNHILPLLPFFKHLVYRLPDRILQLRFKAHEIK